MIDWLGARKPIEIILLMIIAMLIGAAIIEYVIAPGLTWIVTARP